MNYQKEDEEEENLSHNLSSEEFKELTETNDKFNKSKTKVKSNLIYSMDKSNGEETKKIIYSSNNSEFNNINSDDNNEYLNLKISSENENENYNAENEHEIINSKEYENNNNFSQNQYQEKMNNNNKDEIDNPIIPLKINNNGQYNFKSLSSNRSDLENEKN